MKKISLLFVLFLNMHFVFAIDNTFDKPNVNSEFKKLDRIENVVATTGADYQTLVKSNSEVLNGVELNTSVNIAAVRGGDLPLNIPALVWGFCCCLLGVALVYFQTDNDKEQVKKAAIGCAVGGVLWLGLSLLSGGFGSGGYYY
jgi:hypothetical protein